MFKDIALFIKRFFMSSLNEPAYLIAGNYETRSYVSFDFALSYYGLIPEAVYVCTSAIKSKKKRRFLRRGNKTFSYQHVPEVVFECGVNLMYENGISFRIASPEKALCDKLFSMPQILTLREMEYVLEDDLRIDMEALSNFNLRLMKKLSSLYSSENVRILLKYLEKQRLCMKK